MNTDFRCYMNGRSVSCTDSGQHDARTLLYIFLYVSWDLCNNYMLMAREIYFFWIVLSTIKNHRCSLRHFVAGLQAWHVHILIQMRLRCRGACKILWRLKKSKPKHRSFETSRDLAVRRPSAQWIVAHSISGQVIISFAWIALDPTR